MFFRFILGSLHSGGNGNGSEKYIQKRDNHWAKEGEIYNIIVRRLGKKQVSRLGGRIVNNASNREGK